MTSLIPWVGGKGRLIPLINNLAPPKPVKFVDVFGGSGTVTLNQPLRNNCLEIYNDYKSNLTNLISCVKERPIALMKELGFLPFKSRDEFEVLKKFLSCEEFKDEYFEEEKELAKIYFPAPESEEIVRLMSKRRKDHDLKRAAAYFKLIRYSFSGTAKSFGCSGCDIRDFFGQIWKCSRRLRNVAIENKDFESVIKDNDSEKTFFYCDPPYYDAEKHYEVEFREEDHVRHRDVLKSAKGHVMVSYNRCDEILRLYEDFYIIGTTRPNSLAREKNNKYEEVIITNYDPRKVSAQTMLGMGGAEYEFINTPKSESNKGEENEV